jgi:hypothetical protein
VNRYYVLRDEMLEFYVNDALGQLSSGPESQGWEVSCSSHFLRPETNAGLGNRGDPRMRTVNPRSSARRVQPVSREDLRG